MNPHATVLFFLRQFRLIKWNFSMHSTTPYIRCSIFELSQSFPIEFGLKYGTEERHSRSFRVVLDAIFRNWPSKATKILFFNLTTDRAFNCQILITYSLDLKIWVNFYGCANFPKWSLNFTIV